MNRPQLLLSTLQKRLLAAERCTASAKDLPTAADILYRNQGAIKNRLRLFHLFRLQSQLKLDRQMLESMRKPWGIEEDKNFVRIATRCPDNHPGVELQFDPEASKVTVSLPVSRLQLSPAHEKLLLKLAGEHFKPDEGLVKFDVSDFPLKEQNERRAMEILRDLISYVKSDTVDRFEDVALPKFKSHRRPDLEFPKEWLPGQ